MEKFAIDLDKVLDDFELDEDENESDKHYDKLQLEFCRDNSSGIHPSIQEDVNNSNLGAVGGWPNALGDLPPPGIRSPPDGQLDDDDVSPHQSGAEYYSNPICQTLSLATKQLDVNNSLPSFQKEGMLSHNNSESQDLLWPNISHRAAPIIEQNATHDHLSDLLSSNTNYSKCTIDASNSSILGASAPTVDYSPKGTSCKLDIVPADVPQSHGNFSNSVVKHPDILHIQSSSLNIDGNNLNQDLIQNPFPVPEVSADVLPAEHSREPCLLPDLMTTNNPEREGPPPLDFSSFESNPAIVTENSLAASHNNRPAIVEESQSGNRIPEVANVHASFERSPVCNGPNYGAISSEVTQEESSQICSLSQNACDRLISDISSNSNLPLDDASRSLPDVSVVCQNSNLSSSKESSVKHTTDDSDTPMRFNPSAEVDELDLSVELEELEEEHLKLQGAYNTGSFPPSHVLEDVTGSDADKAEASATLGFDLIDGKNTSKSSIAFNEGYNAEVDQVSGINKHQPDPIDRPSEASTAVLNASKIEEVDVLYCDNERSAIASVSCHNGPSDCIEDKTPDEKSIECEDISSGESTTTDTISSSGTLTDGNSASSDLNATSEPAPSLEEYHPDSPSSDSPNSLVTAVYGDASIANVQTDQAVCPSSEDLPDLDSEESVIGLVAPFWTPDEDAPCCQECNTKFTVIRRRHHCRACGRVLCGPCCHFKAPLPYMEYKEARVCATCLQLLAEDRSADASCVGFPGRAPNPNNPMEYCSRIPPAQQVSAGAMGPPPTVMVPVGVLKRDSQNAGSSALGRARSSKQVIFSDGIRPGGDLTELGGQVQASSPYRKTGRSSRRMASNVPEYVFDPNAEIGPLEVQMRNESSPPVVFALQRNLSVLVKLVKLDCCMGMEVWNVATRGLCNVGQEELVVLLEATPGEKSPPSQLFAFFHTTYLQANKGNLVTEMGHSIFTDPDGFLGSKDHGGFLYIRPSFQCLHKLVLPPAPYIFAVLIQKWETPWAKVFPLRLMLRLGAEYRYYPCPLVSIRNRKSVYCEIGHTIMNLLVDFRNYAYTVPVIQGFVIHMEEKKTTLLIPRNRYEKVWKALDNSNDHVLALAANFSPQADSHLVTVEDDDGHYSPQAINIQNRPRSVTGASFIVFNGALKSTSGLKAKSSIVEDGLMVQIPGEMMVSLRDALRNLKDFDIPCGPSFSSEPDELVLLRWTNDDRNFNVGIKSPIDDRQMDGVPSVKIHSSTDFTSNNHLIRWTEVFIIQGENSNSTNDINISRLSEGLARACCVALTPHLMELFTLGLNRVALRATVHQENVGYDIGAVGNKLPAAFMNELDTELIPVIHRGAANITDQPVVLELLFHIMEK